MDTPHPHPVQADGAAGPATAQEDGACQALLRQTLLHRFRHALRAGHSSPLLHLVMRHRQETPPCMQVS